jgi:hypothetical protein
VLASIGVPAGRIVVAFVSDSARLSCMFAATALMTAYYLTLVGRRHDHMSNSAQAEN